MNKNEFCEFIRNMEKTRRNVEKYLEYVSETVHTDLFEYESLCVRILSNFLNLETNEKFGTSIDYYVYETNYGKDILDVLVDGKKFKLETPEDLWDLLEIEK